MSEKPVVETLARFSPAPTTIDRDALLVRVGRASAPKAWPWKFATLGLLVTQLATVAAWAVWPTTPQPSVTNTVYVTAQPEPTVPSPESEQSNSTGSYLSLMNTWDGTSAMLPPAGATVPAGKPLTVGSSRSALPLD